MWWIWLWSTPESTYTHSAAHRTRGPSEHLIGKGETLRLWVLQVTLLIGHLQFSPHVFSRTIWRSSSSGFPSHASWNLTAPLFNIMHMHWRVEWSRYAAWCGCVTMCGRSSPGVCSRARLHTGGALRDHPCPPARFLSLFLTSIPLRSGLGTSCMACSGS